MIINGDGSEELLKIESNSIDLVLIDPPYIISRDSGFKGITENTTTVHGISRSAAIDSVWTPYGAQVTKPGDVSFQYSGNPYSDYKGNPYPVYSKGQLSMGYMVGFSYNYSKKWLFDALVQQAPAVISNNNTSASQSPNFRLSIGYKITK